MKGYGNKVVQTTSLLMVLGLMTACGQSPDNHNSRAPAGGADANAGDTSPMAFDTVVSPPQGYYDALLEREFKAIDQGLSLVQTGTQVLYVNFNGQTVKKGFGTDQSFIVCTKEATVPSSGISAENQADILARVQAYYNEARVKIEVTNTRPTSGAYTTMVVGGSYGDLGCRESRGTLGVAPLDGGNQNPSDIGFVFTRYYSTNKIVASTIAHEAGHSFGLDHTDNVEDLMFASNSDAVKGFRVGRVGLGRVQDGPAVLRANLGAIAEGETQDPVVTNDPTTNPDQNGGNTMPEDPAPAPNGPQIPGNPLGGLDLIAVLGQLLPGVGQGGGLDISALLPQLDDLLSGLGGIAGNGGQGGFGGIGDILSIFTAGIGAGGGGDVVSIFTDLLGGGAIPGNIGDILGGILGGNAQNPITDLLGGLAGGNIGDLLGSLLGGGGFGDILQGGLGDILGGDLLGTLLGAGGLGNIGDLFSILQGVLGNTGGLFSLADQGPQIPDFTAALGINKITKLSDLRQSLALHVKFVNDSFKGQTRTKLLSFLKVAYAQAYKNQIQPKGGDSVASSN